MKKGELNPAKYVDGDVTKQRISKVENDRKYIKSLYSIPVRLPATYKDLITAYITANNKVADEKHQITSVNLWIRSLIDRELGIKPKE